MSNVLVRPDPGKDGGDDVVDFPPTTKEMSEEERARRLMAEAQRLPLSLPANG